jgi:phosphatidylinositol glycan class V
MAQLPNFIISLPMIYVACSAIVSETKRGPTAFLSLGFRGKRLYSLAHAYHLLFMTLYTVLFAHVQIINRIFTFMPIVYWHMAEMIESGESQFPIYFSGVYSVINAVLFAAFYPPA